MGAPDVFDEQLSLKRLTVAFKRSDWRMFEHALMRLAHEIARPSPFRAHAAWQAFWRAAEADPDLPAPLKERLGEHLAQLLKVDVQPALAPAARPGIATSGVALIDLWQSPLRDAAVRHAFRAQLTVARLTPAVRERLSAWLTGEPDELEELLSKFNAAQSAQAAGLNLSEPAWPEALLAGLHRALANQTPPLTRLLDDAASLGPLSVLSLDPGPSWQRHYGPAAFSTEPTAPQAPARLFQLAGALDCFYCPACPTQTRLAPGAPSALALVCPGCGGACGPLVSPGMARLHAPSPLSALWARAGETLRESAAWVLLTPPEPSDESARWLLGQAVEGKRVIVIADDDACLHAWQAQLQARGAGPIVTSHGPADGVLGFLLQGGVPTPSSPEPVAADSAEPSAASALEASAVVPTDPGQPALPKKSAPAAETPHFKKKSRR